MKRILSIFLFAAILVNSLGTIAFADNTVAEKWKTANVLRGDGSGNYGLDNPLLRAELVAMINRMFNISTQDQEESVGNAWYYDDVLAAVQKGYIDGGSDISGEEQVSWAEAVDAIVRATGVFAPVTEGDIKAAAEKSNESVAYSAAVLAKRGICQPKSYADVPTKGEVLNVLDGVYKAVGGIDFTDPQRRYVNDDFTWEYVGAFPSNYYCEADDCVKVKNKNNNNYISIDKTETGKAVDLVKYFPSMTNNLSFGVSVMSEQTEGTKIIADLKTSVYRDNSSILKMQMSNGKIYTTNGAASVKLMDFEPGKWYDIRLDIDIDNGVYDVYINNKLIVAAIVVNGNITVGHLGQVRFGMGSNETGNLCLDNVILYSGDRTEEAKSVVTGEKGAFEIDFQSEDVGVLPPSWSFSVKDNAEAYVVQEKDSDNKCLYMFNDGSSEKNNRLVYEFPLPVTGKLDVEMKLKTDHDTDIHQTVIMENEKVRFALQKDGIDCYDVTRTWAFESNGFEVGKWHDIKLSIDLDKDIYDLYANGNLIHKDVTLVATADDISNLWLQLEGGESSLYIDDIKVTPIAPPSASAAEGFETTPKADATKNSDWMKMYQAAPTGKVIEAENMKLVNFKVVNNANANGGKAIQVAGKGNASATYVFDGESGDYAIKVGYLENQLKKDSTFRVYQNGKEIDYWYGQFDDGLMHVRDVKNKRYVKNGDVFVIEGYYGEDPSTVDYIQFSDKIEADFTRGYLVQEEFHAPGNYARSTWEYSEEGGSVRNMNGTRHFGIMDNSTTKNVWAKRAILAQSGVVSSEFDMIYIIPDDGITMCWRDGEDDIVRFITEGTTVYAENLMGERIAVISNYQKDIQYKAKLTMDIPGKTITVVAPDGNISTMEMKSDIEKIDNFYMYTQKDKKGWMKLKSLDIYTGYMVNETFRTLNEGVVPKNWTITGAAKVIEVKNEAQFDRMALDMPNGSTAKLTYPEISGTSTAKFSFLMKDKGTLTANIGNAKVTVENGDLYIEAGEKVKIWENIKPVYLYYNVLLEQNAETGKLDAYVNNIKKATLDFNLVNGGIDISMTGGDAIVDHIVMHEGIVTSDVPEVVPVDTGDYIIGMQTCDMWHEGEHFGWDCVRPYDNRTPLIGYYDDADQTAVDWEIKYMAEHGVSVYAPCWYREFRNTAFRSYVNDGKIEAFKHSQYSDKMKFMLVYENSSGIDGEDDFLNYVMNQWIEGFIKHPSYLVIDNKPVIAIWNHSYFSQGAGGDAANGVIFEKAEEMLKAEGFDGAIWITNWNGNDPKMAQTQLDRGYDYVYYYGGGHAIEEQTKRFAAQQEMGLIDGIMSISQGWGAEAWGLSPRKTNLTLDEFKRGLEWTKNVYMKGYDDDSLGSKMVLLGNWNELAEGHMYIPSKLTGFGYLDQIRDVFGVNAGNHIDIVPENTLDSLYPGLWD